MYIIYGVPVCSIDKQRRYLMPRGQGRKRRFRDSGKYKSVCSNDRVLAQLDMRIKAIQSAIVQTSVMSSKFFAEAIAHEGSGSHQLADSCFQSAVAIESNLPRFKQKLDEAQEQKRRRVTVLTRMNFRHDPDQPRL